MTGSSGEQQLLERLRKAAETLNRESDALSGSLRDVERALNALALGVQAQLAEPILEEEEIPEDEEETASPAEYKVRHVLGYGKCVGKSGSQWGLYVLSEHPSGVSPYRGIGELPRDLRVRAARHLASLLDLIAGEAEKKVREVKEAQASAQKAVKALEPSTAADAAGADLTSPGVSGSRRGGRARSRPAPA